MAGADEAGELDLLLRAGHVQHHDAGAGIVQSAHRIQEFALEPVMASGHFQAESEEEIGGRLQVATVIPTWSSLRMRGMAGS
nr:hypothetical protein [Arthrobacter sp. JCM 19049]